MKTGAIYYSDCQLDPKIMSACQRQILKGIKEENIVSCTLKPVNFGQNIVLPLQRGYLAYFKQILTALEASDSDIIRFLEHDVLYHPSHFEFTPAKKDVYYYNTNFWRLRIDDGHAVSYETDQVNMICAYRELLVQNYKERVKRIEALGNVSDKEVGRLARKMGFEPGTHNRKERVDMNGSERWQSEYPNIDIRHGHNLTASRWSQDQFRNQKNCQNWKETTADKIDGWDASMLAFE